MRAKIALFLGVFALSEGAHAQDAASMMATLRSRYEKCVFGSAMDQLRQTPTYSTVDASMVTEIAFQACHTEERAIRLLAASRRMDGITLESAMTGIKLRIKNEVREGVATGLRQERGRQ